jgi:hypothetical protein
MPKLLLFAPCEKAIIDGPSNMLSLIGVLHEIHYKLPPGTTVPPNFAVPMQWAVVALWQEEKSDAGIEYEQQVNLEDATGQLLMHAETRWKFDKGEFQRNIANVTGLPISRILTLALNYRVAGHQHWTRVTSFPICCSQDVL